MPSPERGPDRPDQPPRAEGEPYSYRAAARFSGERPAGRAYSEAQTVLYDARAGTDLSIYRLQLDQLWYVAAIGLTPPATVLAAIERILSTGESATLPEEIWNALDARRQQSTKQGAWVERHHRPGKRF